eukprot:3531145-Rhodomonas_salina.1
MVEAVEPAAAANGGSQEEWRGRVTLHLVGVEPGADAAGLEPLVEPRGPHVVVAPLVVLAPVVRQEHVEPLPRRHPRHLP